MSTSKALAVIEDPAARGDWVWYQLHWPRPLDAEQVSSLLRRLASNRLPTPVVVETRAARGRTAYFLAAGRPRIQAVLQTLHELVPGLVIDQPERSPRQQPLQAGLQLRLRPTTHQNLSRHTPHEATAATIHAALAAAAGKGEELVLQTLLGPGVPPKPVQSGWSWIRALGMTTNASHRTQSQPGISPDRLLRCTIRIGVRAEAPFRRQALATDLLSALATTESGSLRLDSRRCSPAHLEHPTLPWFTWSGEIPITILADLIGAPISTGELPGLPPLHPRQVAPETALVDTDRVIGRTTAPGRTQLVGVSIKDAMTHLLALGPTGSGKSTVLLNTLVADAQAGRGLCLIDPKRSLVDDFLQTMPKERLKDTFVVDPSAANPLGFNPLASQGRSPDVVVDGILTAIQDIFDGLGPRSTDILQSCLLTLIQHPGSTLADIPHLLDDPAFRLQKIGKTAADPTLASFWAWYQGLSPTAQSSVTAPLLNKLRMLLRPQLRRIFDQPDPGWSLNTIFTQSKIVLVPLNKSLIGPSTAALLGSLIIAELWQCVLARVIVPEKDRKPVIITVDEVQDYLKIGDLADALNQSRSYKVGWQLAHQFRQQLGPGMLAAVDANARSKLIFAPAPKDAAVVAATSHQLETIDFLRLKKHHIYATLQTKGETSGWFSAATFPEPPKLRSLDEALMRINQLTPAPAVEHPPPTAAKAEAEKKRQPPVPADSNVIGRRKKSL